jgi:phage shock protein PspC (stress-responsive transcriptional regulator)
MGTEDRRLEDEDMTEHLTPNEPTTPDDQPMADEPGSVRIDEPTTENAGDDGTAGGEPAPGAPAPPPPPPRWLRRAERGPLAGVATGIADYFRIDPILVQAAFIAFTIFGGSGVLLYLAGWLLIPKADDPEPRPVAIATRSTVAVVFGVIFVVGAAFTLFGSFSLGTGDNALLPLLLIGGGLLLLNQRADRPDVVAPRRPDPRDPAPHWAAPRMLDEVAITSPAPAEPRLPVTSVTLALAALVAGGIIAVNQWTDASVGAAGVIGAALAVVGCGLVFSAFRGRALPLIPVGLLLIASLFAAPVFDATARGGLGDRTARPINESEVLDRYDLGAGPFDIDLRNVEFVEDRTIVVDVGAGYAEIVVPDDVRVHVEATNGVGTISLFGSRYEGVAHSASASRSPAISSGVTDAEASRLDVIVNVTFGYVEVRRG